MCVVVAKNGSVVHEMLPSLRGKTCRQTITEAYAAWKRGETKKPGKLFWEQIRADFADIEGLAARVLVLQDPLPEPAFEVFKGLLKSHPQRGPFRTWMTSLAKCSKAEAIIMAKALMTLNPAALGDQKVTGNLILSTLARLGVQTEWPQIIDACGSKIDAWLTKVLDGINMKLQSHGNSGTPPDVFLRENEEVVYMLLPKEEVKAILGLATNAKLTECKSEVCSLWAHCELGKALFGGAMRRIACESVESVVMDAMTAVQSVAVVSEQHVQTVLRDAAKKLQFMAGVDDIGKQTVQFTYRGLPIEHCCSTPLDQVEYHLRVCIRERGCQEENS
eukprot:2835354-Amphidinium_carterae.1